VTKKAYVLPAQITKGLTEAIQFSREELLKTGLSDHLDLQAKTLCCPPFLFFGGVFCALCKIPW
jgi:hypothetical protein